MAAGPSLYRLNKTQRGAEASLGAGGPATFQTIGDGLLTLQQSRYMADYPRGVRAPYTAGGVLVQQGTTLAVTTELTYEEILDPLNAGIATGVIATVSGVTSHTFTPILTADPVPKSLFYEAVMGDGVSNLLAATMAAGLCSGFKIDWAFGQVAKLSYTMFGRVATLNATPTAALVAMTGREVIPSNLFKVFIDDTWAGLGGTQKSGTIRSGSLTVDTGIDADYTLDGRAGLDYTRYNWGNVTGTLSLVMEYNGNAKTELEKWFNGTAAAPGYRFVRLKATSPVVLGSGFRDFQIDGCFVYNKEPSFSHDSKSNVELATMQLALEYDPTSSKLLLPVIKNGLATFT